MMPGKRWILLAAGLIAGALLGEAVKLLWLPELGFGWSVMVTAVFSIGAGWSALALDERVIRGAEQHQLRQAELEEQVLRLNQELVMRSQAQNSELARLNVELALQIAMLQQTEEIARSNEERFRNMADHIQDGLTIIENGLLVYVNQRAYEIFGADPDGSLAQRIQHFALAEEQQRLQPVIDQAALGGELPREIQYWIERSDGTRACIREHYSTSQTEGRQRTFVITSDVTERMQAYQHLEQAVDDRTRQLLTVLEVSKRIVSTLELEPLLHLILDQIQEIIPYSGAAIFTLEEDRLELAAYLVPELSTTMRALTLQVENTGQFKPVIVDKQVVIIDDVEGHSPLAQAYEETTGKQPNGLFSYARSWIGIPLVIHERVMGILSLTHKQPGYYQQTHAHLAQSVTYQVAVAIENARLYEKAQNLATLEERNRIARELHDSVTQLLYGISLYCTATSRALRSENYAQVAENLVEIKDNALQALREMRLLILELNPPMLQKKGLVAALQSSLEVIEARTGLETALDVDGIDRLPHAVEPELYRIAMEALNNLVRYSHARKVTVNLQSRGGWVFMEICDNGVGFNLEKARQGAGMGLPGMEQRAAQIGGRLEISSKPGEGTVIRVEAPL